MLPEDTWTGETACLSSTGTVGVFVPLEKISFCFNALQRGLAHSGQLQLSRLRSPCALKMPQQDDYSPFSLGIGGMNE